MSDPEVDFTQTEAIAAVSEYLQPIFANYPDIQAAYLFGSGASSRRRPGSDWDLALAPRSNNLRRQKLDILADLVQAGFDNVDLVILDTGDVVLQYEAVRLNQLIYQADDFEPATLYSNIVRKYLDFLPYLKVQRQAYKRRILDG